MIFCIIDCQHRSLTLMRRFVKFHIVRFVNRGFVISMTSSFPDISVCALCLFDFGQLFFVKLIVDRPLSGRCCLPLSVAAASGVYFYLCKFSVLFYSCRTIGFHKHSSCARLCKCVHPIHHRTLFKCSHSFCRISRLGVENGASNETRKTFNRVNMCLLTQVF